MSVVNGQPNSAEVLNPAYISRTVDSGTVGKLNLNNVLDVNSGPVVINAQRAINETFDAVGMTGVADATRKNYSSNNVVTNGDSHKTAIGKLDLEFSSAGHRHSGVSGDGAKVWAADIDNVPLKGYVVRGADLSSVTGTTLDITTQMSGKSPSANPTTAGVVVVAPQNIAMLRNISGNSPDDIFKDSLGNTVFSRVTESAGTWTLSFFTDVSGTETAYNFTVSSNIRWYYQELWNPLSSAAPVYSEILNIPSDNVAESILTATTTLQGKVQLSASVGSNVSGTATVGTTNGTVANADHVHKGVFSLGVFSDATKLFDAIDLEAGNSIVITRVGQRLKIDAGGAVLYQDFLGTGNGVTTLFGPMSNPPSSAESVFVFLDNILVEKTDRTIIGSSVSFPVAPAAAQRVYVCYASNGVVIPPAPSGTFEVEYRTLTGGEIAAKQLTLTATPNAPSKVLVTVIGGSAQIFAVDFTVASNILDWNTLGLDGLVIAGDVLLVTYFS